MARVTPKEWEVAELISFGLTEKEIARCVDSSVNTVKSHKKSLFIKTGSRNISDVTRWYIQETSGIRLEPKNAIKKFISILLLLLVLLADFSSSEFMRARVRVRNSSALIARLKAWARSKQSFYLQTA